MQINKRGKPPKRRSQGSFIDNDFASGFEDSKFEKFRPVLKVLAIILVLASIAWGVSAYFIGTEEKTDINKTYTPPTSSQEAIGEPEPKQSEQADSSDSDYPTDAAPSGGSAQRQNIPSGNGTTSSTKKYDPSKCEPLNNEATRLRQAAEQKKTTFDNAFAARKNYGYFYEQYGNSTDAQQAYDNQEAQLDLLQEDWEDALKKGNAVYSKYQECRANL